MEVLVLAIDPEDDLEHRVSEISSWSVGVSSVSGSLVERRKLVRSSSDVASTLLFHVHVGSVWEWRHPPNSGHKCRRTMLVVSEVCGTSHTTILFAVFASWQS